MMDIVFDERLGILRCISVGTTSFAEVEAFSRKAAALQELARARRGGCLILVDAMRTAVYTQETAAHFADQAATRFRPGDRTAIVIESALSRMQARRLTHKDATAYFTTEDEALAWLLAGLPDRRG